MDRIFLLSLAMLLSACSSTTSKPFSSKDVTTFVSEGHSKESVIYLGPNFSNSLQRLRTLTLPKLKLISQDYTFRLFVEGYTNYVNGYYDSQPFGGGSDNPVPSHAALTVFKGSGFKVIQDSCPPPSKVTPNDFLIRTSIPALDEQVVLQNEGWDLSLDESSGMGNYDTSDWFSESKLALLTQIIRCSDREIRMDDYSIITLRSKNESESFLLLGKALGIYRNSSLTTKVSAQLDRDKTSILTMMKFAAELAGLTKSEFELAIFGVTSTYNKKTGFVKTVSADSKFDKSLAKIIFISEFFGSDTSETIVKPYSSVVELKLKNNQIPTLEGGVIRKLDMKILYKDEVIYTNSLI